MPYSYDTTVPVPNQFPSQNVQAMQTNTASIAGLISEDHVGFGEDNAGQHLQVRFPLPLSSDPSPTMAAGELYTKEISTISQLFFANSVGVFPLTNPPIVTTSTTVGGITVTCNGMKTPWGLILNWGYVRNAGTAGTTVTYSVPYTSNLMAIVTGASGSFPGTDACSTSDEGKGTAATTFVMLSSQNPTDNFFLAIGI